MQLCRDTYIIIIINIVSFLSCYKPICSVLFHKCAELFNRNNRTQFSSAAAMKLAPEGPEYVSIEEMSRGNDNSSSITYRSTINIK